MLEALAGNSGIAQEVQHMIHTPVRKLVFGGWGVEGVEAFIPSTGTAQVVGHVSKPGL